MGKLIIIGGASGAGKTFLIDTISGTNKSIHVIKKLTTRPPRPYEQQSDQVFATDLELHCAPSEVQTCDYTYWYGKFLYGVRKTEIESYLKQGMNPVLIIRNGNTIKKIKDDFPDALVLYVQSGLSGSDLQRVLQEQGRLDIEITDRLIRQKADFDDYVKNINLFDHVLINYYTPSLETQLCEVLERSKITETKPGYVFVIMPFDENYNKTYDAIKLLERVYSKHNIEIDRVDSQSGDFKIMEEIQRGIQSSTFVICDVTDERPNVYYELGYARALRKTIFTCAKNGTKLHFDISQNSTIFYSDGIDLQTKLMVIFENTFARKYA